MSEPLVSVVIATWNTARYFPEALGSVLAQTDSRYEIIVVDDGSTDDTAAAVERFRPRIRFIQREHEGLASARNAGVALAQGEYIALLDADDFWGSRKLAMQLAVAERHPDSGLIACNGVEFEGDTILRRRLLSGPLVRALRSAPELEIHGHFHRELLLLNPIACPAQTLIPRKVLDIIGPFANSPAQDYDCYLRIAQRFPITLHRHSLVGWRFRSESMSGPRDARRVGWTRAVLNVLRAHASRCTPEERMIIEQRCEKMVVALAAFKPSHFDQERAAGTQTAG